MHIAYPVHSIFCAVFLIIIHITTANKFVSNGHPKMLIMLDKQEAKTGETVTFTCDVMNKSTLLHFRWYCTESWWQHDDYHNRVLQYGDLDHCNGHCTYHLEVKDASLADNGTTCGCELYAYHNDDIAAVNAENRLAGLTLYDPVPHEAASSLVMLLVKSPDNSITLSGHLKLGKAKSRIGESHSAYERPSNSKSADEEDPNRYTIMVIAIMFCILCTVSILLALEMFVYKIYENHRLQKAVARRESYSFKVKVP